MRAAGTMLISPAVAAVLIQVAETVDVMVVSGGISSFKRLCLRVFGFCFR